MAPDATLLLAQANGPMQVYNAAKWLKAKGAKVIVHAAGWQYDSPGDGTIHFPITMHTGIAREDRHTADHYYPSPLATVEYNTANNGPIWVNAAGNHDKWTMWLDSPDVIEDDDSDYYGYVIFDDDEEDHIDKTCQRMPIKTGEVGYYSMRWHDTWPVAQKKLDYMMTHTKLLGNSTYSHYGSSGNSGVIDADFADDHDDAAPQYPVNYPVRRSSHLALNLRDICLRIKVHDLNTRDDDAPEAPPWIQFQALVSKGLSHNGPAWESDTAGRSIVNPSESDNPRPFGRRSRQPP